MKWAKLYSSETAGPFMVSSNMLTLGLLGVGGQAAHLEAGGLSHCKGRPRGHAAPPQLLQALHLQ